MEKDTVILNLESYEKFKKTQEDYNNLLSKLPNVVRLIHDYRYGMGDRMVPFVYPQYEGKDEFIQKNVDSYNKMLSDNTKFQNRIDNFNGLTKREKIALIRRGERV